MDRLLTSLLLFLCPLILALHRLIARRFSSSVGKRSSHHGLMPPEPSGSWPLIGHLHHLWGREPAFQKLAAMADKCGPVFSLKIGLQRFVVVSSSEAARECFTINDKVLATRPDTAAGRYVLIFDPFGLPKMSIELIYYCSVSLPQ